MKIIVRAPNWIGDSVLALPAIQSLSQTLPESQFWVAAKEWVQDIFLFHDFIKGTIPLPGEDDLKSLKESANKIKGFDFDAGVLFTNSFVSAFLFYLAKIPERWGYSRDGRGLLLTRKVSTKKLKNSIHQADYYKELISGLGFKAYLPSLFLPQPKEKSNQETQQMNPTQLKRKSVFISRRSVSPTRLD